MPPEFALAASCELSLSSPANIRVDSTVAHAAQGGTRLGARGTPPRTPTIVPPLALQALAPAHRSARRAGDCQDPMERAAPSRPPVAPTSWQQRVRSVGAAVGEQLAASQTPALLGVAAAAVHPSGESNPTFSSSLPLTHARPKACAPLRSARPVVWPLAVDAALRVASSEGEQEGCDVGSAVLTFLLSQARRDVQEGAGSRLLTAVAALGRSLGSAASWDRLARHLCVRLSRSALAGPLRGSLADLYVRMRNSAQLPALTVVCRLTCTPVSAFFAHNAWLLLPFLVGRCSGVLACDIVRAEGMIERSLPAASSALLDLLPHAAESSVCMYALLLTASGLCGVSVTQGPCSDTDMAVQFFVAERGLTSMRLFSQRHRVSALLCATGRPPSARTDSRARDGPCCGHKRCGRRRA